MSKRIRVLGYGKSLDVSEINALLGNLAAACGIETPSWTMEPIYSVHSKVVHGNIELGFYDQNTDRLHFNTAPDTNLVSHELGHLLFHKLHPGACDGTNPECESFARAFARQVEYPTGPFSLVPWGPVRRSLRKELYGF